jgi:hypothetical protein
MGSRATDGMGRERASSQARLSASRNAVSRTRSSSPSSKTLTPWHIRQEVGASSQGQLLFLYASPPPTARGFLSLSCAVSLNGVSYSCPSRTSGPPASSLTPGGFSLGGMGPPLGPMLPWPTANLQPQHLTPRVRRARGQPGRGLMNNDHGEVRQAASLLIVKDQPEHQAGHIGEADAESPHRKP